MRFLPSVAAAVLVAGCASDPPSTGGGPDPADPAAPAAASAYRSPLEGTADYRPVEPRSWTERNDAVNPSLRRRR